MKNKFLYLAGIALFLSMVYFNGCGFSAVKTDAAFPSKRIEIIVPFGPGGGSDAHARALQKVAAKYLNQPLVAINKPGGGGNVGYSELVTAAPDGYTWGVASPEIIFHSVYGQSKYHFLTALDPIAQICTASLVLVVNADSPWHSVDDVIQYARSHNEPLRFAHSGIGSASHVLGEVFGKKYGVKTTQVPFKGGSEKNAMLLGNHVDLMFHSSTAVLEFVKSGKMRVLALASSKRLQNPVLADVPTFKELGKDIELNNWYGIATPKPLDDKVKAVLSEKLKAMILDPEFKTILEQLGTELDYLSPTEFQEKWIQEADNFKKMVTETGIIEQMKKLQ